MPKISVIMPMYNQQDYIVECIESVINQTLKDIEIIVVNDGSTDKSPDIVREYAKKDKRIIFIDKRNSGYGNSMNVGIEAATGEYIGIVETDDFISKDMYEVLYRLSDNGKTDIVKCNFYDYYENGDKKEAVVNTERRNMDAFDENQSFNVRENPNILWGHPSVWSAIYKSELIKNNNIKFIEAKGGGWVDNPFFFQTLFLAKSYKWTSRPFYFYRKTNANSSSVNITNPVLPYERMSDNLKMAEKCGYTDDETLKFLYARALMYMDGTFKECDYGNNFEIINKYAKALMRSCHNDVFDRYFNSHDQYLYYRYASPLRSISFDFPKILIYNWVPVSDRANRGGGVTIYCRNLIETILKERPAAQIYFLSSGCSYTSSNTDTFIRPIDSMYGERVREFEIVNSPVPADQWLIYRNPSVAIENEKLKKIFKSFLDRFGRFDVIHFNNIEGLSADIMDLKKEYPDTKFIFSIHNYNPICLTGFYYQRHNHCICNKDHTPEDCFRCSRVNIGENNSYTIYRYCLDSDTPEEKRIPYKEWIRKTGIDKIDIDIPIERTTDFAREMTRKINENCDNILAVSKRVYDICADNGFEKTKMSVSYIGTRVARAQVGKSLSDNNGKIIKVVFLGNDLHYEEKGYPFLLKALEHIEKEYASRIELVLTTRSKDYEYIYDYLNDFKSIKIYNGYTHGDLKEILHGCDISIVPVLWEDNLPQIAIESVAYGVPVLSSSAGGASELCSSDKFRFESGNIEDFISKLKHFVDNPEDLQEYWQHHKGLVTMHEHWQELNEKYYGIKGKDIVLSEEDFSYLMMENNFLYGHTMFCDGEYFGSRWISNEEQKRIVRDYLENEESLNFLKQEQIYPGGLYFRLIRFLNKLFPKNGVLRRFLKRIFGGRKK